MTAPTGRPRGRPPYQPPPDVRDDIELMVLAGMAHAAIAKALEIDIHTLEKYFRVELDEGVSRKKREVLGMLYATAQAGNVAAQKTLLDVAERREVGAVLDKHVPVRLQPGKKERAQMDAERAGEGTPWERYLRDDEPGLPAPPN